MATVKHTEWINSMLGAPTHSVIDLNTDDIDVSLIDQTDSGTIDATDVDYADVNAGVVVATAETTLSIVSGVVSLSGPVTFPTVTGDGADYLVCFKNSGTPTTSPLIITWDSTSTGLPVVPNGADIVATWGSNVLVTLA